MVSSALTWASAAGGRIPASANTPSMTPATIIRCDETRCIIGGDSRRLRHRQRRTRRPFSTHPGVSELRVNTQIVHDSSMLPFWQLGSFDRFSRISSSIANLPQNNAAVASILPPRGENQCMDNQGAIVPHLVIVCQVHQSGGTPRRLSRKWPHRHHPLGSAGSRKFDDTDERKMWREMAPNGAFCGLSRSPAMQKTGPPR